MWVRIFPNALKCHKLMLVPFSLSHVFYFLSNHLHFRPPGFSRHSQTPIHSLLKSLKPGLVSQLLVRQVGILKGQGKFSNLLGCSELYNMPGSSTSDLNKRLTDTEQFSSLVNQYWGVPIYRDD